MAKKHDLEITSAIVLGGKVKPKGSIVSVDVRLAKNLLSRGKAELHASTVAAGDDDNSDDVADLGDHTVAELKEIAAEYEIDGSANMNKADLIKAIETAEAAAGKGA